MLDMGVLLEEAQAQDMPHLTKNYTIMGMTKNYTTWE